MYNSTKTYLESSPCVVYPKHLDTTKIGCWIMKFAGLIHPPFDFTYSIKTFHVKTVYSKRIPIYGWQERINYDFAYR